MVRAAAKNHGNEAGGVGIVTDPGRLRGHRRGTEGQRRRAQLPDPLRPRQEGLHPHRALRRGDLQPPHQPRRRRQQAGAFPERLQLAFDKVEDLRYGENPHQHAAFYREPCRRPAPSPTTCSCRARSSPTTTSPTPMRRGNASRPSKPATAAACVIVKHANPCGVAVAPSAGGLQEGLQDRPDLGLRRHHRLQLRGRRATAEAVSGQFLEVLIAPEITAEARAVFARPSRTCAC
jgi:phosphoribosylaminoimidazolecarboxamide formyltransferase/IMP cyclohydrolase